MIGHKPDMTRIDALMIRTLLAPRAPVPNRGVAGVILTLAAAIAACEVRTSGMGLHRSDGRTAGIVDPVLLQIAQVVEVMLLVL